MSVPGQPVIGVVVPAPGVPIAPVAAAPVELRVELAPGSNVFVVVGLPDDVAHTIDPADVRAIRAAAAPLVAELARRGLIARAPGTLEDQ